MKTAVAGESINKKQLKSTKSPDEVKVVVSRMMEAYGVDKTRGLEAVSGHKADTIRGWSRTPCSMPYPALDECSRATGVSMDWLLYGKGQYHSGSDEILLEIITNALRGGVEYSQIEQTSPSGIQNLAKKIKTDIRALLDAQSQGENTTRPSPKQALSKVGDF